MLCRKAQSAYQACKKAAVSNKTINIRHADIILISISSFLSNADSFQLEKFSPVKTLCQDKKLFPPQKTKTYSA
ncbi:MAG: hypothetical protein A2096_01005 [Spirochaetes bacterium GWF1_41_5]|nr:MAG: hypothetical protein A2096_01005 [Spirochaetes bacterium GWF1_41_5]